MKSEEFDDKNVLFVGASVSAFDHFDIILNREDTKGCVKPKQIYVTSRDISLYEKSDSFKANIEKGELIVIPGNISEISENTVKFGIQPDGTEGPEIEIDTIIYATGYQYCLPFFKPADNGTENIIEFDGEQQDRGNYFGPVYMKIWAVRQPRVMFIGLVENQYKVWNWFERQIQLCKQFINGELELPDKEAMLTEIEEETKFHTKVGHQKF